MAIFLHTKRHLLTRFIFWLLVIVFVGLSPVILGFLGAWINEMVTGQPCHEGNCEWMVIPWLSIITIPIAGLTLTIYLIISLIDIVKLFANKK